MSTRAIERLARLMIREVIDGRADLCPGFCLKTYNELVQRDGVEPDAALVAVQDMASAAGARARDLVRSGAADIELRRAIRLAKIVPRMH